mmetsp:Transcript_73288/g.162140  ORF Transcript_73288/g.162140 Transcript_73288/m.162140 type:complete len:260 (+) Transcript_73288:105-884(+)
MSKHAVPRFLDAPRIPEGALRLEPECRDFNLTVHHVSHGLHEEFGVRALLWKVELPVDPGINFFCQNLQEVRGEHAGIFFKLVEPFLHVRLQHRNRHHLQRCFALFLCEEQVQGPVAPEIGNDDLLGHHVPILKRHEAQTGPLREHLRLLWKVPPEDSAKLGDIRVRLQPYYERAARIEELFDAGSLDAHFDGCELLLLIFHAGCLFHRNPAEHPQLCRAQAETGRGPHRPLCTLEQLPPLSAGSSVGLQVLRGTGQFC